jgi:hypothetical protein
MTFTIAWSTLCVTIFRRGKTLFSSRNKKNCKLLWAATGKYKNNYLELSQLLFMSWMMERSPLIKTSSLLSVMQKQTWQFERLLPVQIRRISVMSLMTQICSFVCFWFLESSKKIFWYQPFGWFPWKRLEVPFASKMSIQYIKYYIKIILDTGLYLHQVATRVGCNEFGDWWSYRLYDWFSELSII